MSALPSTPHDWAIWLLSSLEEIKPIGGGLLAGVLPDEYDFDEVLEAINARAGSLLGVPNKTRRVIEFNPSFGHVYETLDAMLSVSANRHQVPSKFTILSLHYTGPDDPAPAEIASYLDAAKLWKLLSDFADYEQGNGQALVFIQSPESRLTIVQKYEISDFRGIVGIAEFDRDYVRSELHSEQKRNIVRASLVETFQGKKKVSFGEVLRSFDGILSSIKASYAAYAADFSYEKFREQLEKDNLDDTLRLNKTISDIQNQLLALPAALILASATIAPDAHLKNAATVAGMLLFALFMSRLISNQRHSVEAIKDEIDLRKGKLDRQPEVFSGKFADAFEKLQKRALKQLRTLFGVKVAVWLVFWSVVVMVLVALLAPNALKGAAADQPPPIRVIQF